MFESFSWVRGGYRKVDAGDIPDTVGRCGFCGGGRPEPTRVNPGQRTESSGDPGRPKALEKPERVGAMRPGRGARVLDQVSGEEHTWMVVAAVEADASAGKLSTQSPIAQALLGHVAGETVSVETPRGPRDYTLLEVLG
jgi:hypothetical protein